MTKLSPEQVNRVANAPAFARIDRSTLEILASEMDEVRLGPGDALIRQGELADRLFIVLEGDLQAVLDQPEGAQILREIHEGDLVGEVALITGGERTATVRAITRVVAASLTADDLRRLVLARPEAAEALTRIIAERLHRSQLAKYLGRLFGSMELAALKDVEESVEWVRLRSGEVLFRQGDHADAAFVVISGRLRVTVREESGEERTIGETRRGETVGEIALLTKGVRSATVYANRDSELARFSQEAFDRLTTKYPSAMMHMTRLIGTRLQSMTLRGTRSQRVLDTIAIVPASGSEWIGEFARRLSGAMQLYGSTTVITSTDVDAALGREGYAQIAHDDPGQVRLSQWLAEQENEYRFVIYLTDRVWNGWTERATSQADQIMVVANAGGDPAPTEVERLLRERWDQGRSPRRGLVLLHASGQKEPRGTAQWLEARVATQHHHVRLDRDDDFERVARILTGNSVSVVFGGGGARGFAHIGVVRALEENGVPIDMVGGTSMGAIIAGNIAMGLDSAMTLEGSRAQLARIFDYTIPIVSMLSARRLTRRLDQTFGGRDIEDLWIPFFCVATNLTRGNLVIHRRGNVSRAVRSSVALPGVMPPVYSDGDLLVDGGLLNNVPVDVMRSLAGGGRLIAVDVTPAVDLGSKTPFEPELSGWKVLFKKINPFDQKVDVPNIVNILYRSTVIASVHSRNRMLTEQMADLYLDLDVSNWGMLEFDAIDEIAETGYGQSVEQVRRWSLEGGSEG